MAYIQPEGTIGLIRDSQLSADYKHTIRFKNREEQVEYFVSKCIYRLSQYNYQNYSKNTIRVDVSQGANLDPNNLPDSVLTCDYMYFTNRQYNSGTGGYIRFYAFIDRVTRLSNNVFEIEYSIDPLQTWYFYMKVNPCMVEREHSLTDELGEHLLAEPISVGEQIVQQTWSNILTDTPVETLKFELVIWYTPNRTGTNAQVISGYRVTLDDDDNYVTNVSYRDATSSDFGVIQNGVFMGCTFVGIPMQLGNDLELTKAAIGGIIDSLISHGANIINIAQIPYNIWIKLTTGDSSPIYSNYERSDVFVSNPKSLTYGYIPKNNKLYTSPYRSIVVSNNVGQRNTYKWELFRTQKTAQFYTDYSAFPSTEVNMYPYGYRGVTNDYESGIALTEFPTCAWSEDSFARWWSINKNAYITSTLSTAVATIASMVAIGATGGTAAPLLIGTTAIGGFTSLAKQYSQSNVMQNTPDTSKGQLVTGSLLVKENRIGYTIYDMGITSEEARYVDDFFSLYGYTCERIKLPNVFTPNAKLRPYWNYLKTRGCVVHPLEIGAYGIPAEYSVQIEKIFDNGITFWETNDNTTVQVGNYFDEFGRIKDNSPVKDEESEV